MNKIEINETEINNIILDILELSRNNLSNIEHNYIEKTISNKYYNDLRIYIESCVSSSQSKVLHSILIDNFDTVYAKRYKTVKKIDNLITYICQELI